MVSQSPYWEDDHVERSKEILNSIKLTLPKETKINSPTETYSWFDSSYEEFDVEKQKGLWKDFFEAHEERWGETKREKKTFVSKITRIYPTEEQKKTLVRWNNDAKLIYNTTVGTLNGTSKKSNKYQLRNDLVIAKNTKVTDPKILLSMERTPKDIRAKAVFEATAAHNLSLKKTITLNPKYVATEKLITKTELSMAKLEKERARKKNPISKEEFTEKTSDLPNLECLKEDLKWIPKFQAKNSNLKFRTKKDQYSHIFIPKTAAKIKGNNLQIYPNYKLGSIRIKPPRTKKTQVKITSDFQIRYHRKLDVWHIITSEEINLAEKREEYKTVVIDPGVRAFLTCIDSEGLIAEIGKDWALDKKIKERMFKMDRADRMSKEPLKGKRGQERFNSLIAKRNFNLHRRKLHNMINDLHKKTANILLEEYDVIVLPKLRAKTILKSDDGLGNLVNRRFSLLAHGKFHDYITWKAQTLGKTVIDQSERFTTKTCFSCGVLNDIGPSKVYICESCGNVSDRDVQSCFNILTRYMGSYTPRT